MRHRETDVQHQLDGFVVGVGLPAVARDEFVIHGGQRGDKARIRGGHRLRFLPARQDAGNQQTRGRVALLVEVVEQFRMTLQERDLVGIGVEGEGPLIDGAATSLIAKRGKVGQAADSMGQAGWAGVDEFLREAATS